MSTPPDAIRLSTGSGGLEWPEVLTERKPKEEAGEADKAGGEKKK
jgi:hypothetical protein